VSTTAAHPADRFFAFALDDQHGDAFIAMEFLDGVTLKLSSWVALLLLSSCLMKSLKTRKP